MISELTTHFTGLGDQPDIDAYMAEVRGRKVSSLRERILSSSVKKDSNGHEITEAGLKEKYSDSLFVHVKSQGVLPIRQNEAHNPILQDMGYQQSQSQSYLKQIIKEVAARDDGSAFFSIQLDILRLITRSCALLESGSDDKEAYDLLKKAEKSAIGLILDPKAGYKGPLLRLLMIILHNLAYFCLRYASTNH
jgi:hypothetical protein